MLEEDRRREDEERETRRQERELRKLELEADPLKQRKAIEAAKREHELELALQDKPVTSPNVLN